MRYQDYVLIPSTPHTIIGLFLKIILTLFSVAAADEGKEVQSSGNGSGHVATWAAMGDDFF